MKKISRKLYLLVAIVMALSLFASACGSTETSEGTSIGGASATQATSTGSEAAKPALEPYEIVWYYDGPGPQRDVELIQDKMNEYLKDKLNVTVKLNAIDWGNYDTKLQTIMAVGEKIDLAFSCSWALSYNNAVAKGWLTDLTDLLDKNAPDAKKALEERDWLKPQAINGRIYNLPTIKEMASQAGILFNKNMADKLGLDLSTIKTINDLEPIYKKAKEADKTITPLIMTKNINVSHLGLGWDLIMPANISNGIIFDRAADKWTAAFGNAQYMDYLNIVRKFYTEGYINKDSATLSDHIPAIKAGNVLSWPSQLKPGKDIEEAKTYGFPVAQIGLSKIVSQQGDLTGSMMAIPKTSKDPERVLQFYNLFYSDEYLINLMDYGIEGTHWEWFDKDKKMVQYAAATNEGKESGWNHGTNWIFGNQLLSYTFKGDDPEKWKRFDEFNKAAVRNPDFGFSFDAEPVKKEVAAIKSIDTEFQYGLFTGFMDPVKYVPAWEKKLKDAGLDKVLEEMNKQYDAFKAAK